MKAVLISIQPPHTDNIFDLVKGIEWRTKPMSTGKYYCYETKNGGGCGKVIGEFTINRIRGYDNANNIPANYIDLGCVPREFLMTYSKGKRIYAHFIVNPKRYDKPKELREFFHYCGDNPNCDGCEAHYYSNTECGKEDYCCSIIEGCKPLKRPFQSWGYVYEADT